MTLAGGYRAAGDSLRIGGDFYDVVPPPATAALFALGDVCGKGVGAAVLTGRVRQSLQTLRLVEQRPLELMELLNRALFDAPDAARRGQFTTLLLGALTPGPDGGLLVRVAGGGHPPRWSSAPTARSHRSGSAACRSGALTAARFAETQVQLAPGDLLLAYTDGVTEAAAARATRRCSARPGCGRRSRRRPGYRRRALVDRVLRAVDEWLGGQAHDDIAMLAVAAAPGSDRPGDRPGRRDQAVRATGGPSAGHPGWRRPSVPERPTSPSSPVGSPVWLERPSRPTAHRAGPGRPGQSAWPAAHPTPARFCRPAGGGRSRRTPACRAAARRGPPGSSRPAPRRAGCRRSARSSARSRRGLRGEVQRDLPPVEPARLPLQHAGGDQPVAEPAGGGEQHVESGWRAGAG